MTLSPRPATRDRVRALYREAKRADEHARAADAAPRPSGLPPSTAAVTPTPVEPAPPEAASTPPPPLARPLPPPPARSFSVLGLLALIAVPLGGIVLYAQGGLPDTAALGTQGEPAAPTRSSPLTVERIRWEGSDLRFSARNDTTDSADYLFTVSTRLRTDRCPSIGYLRAGRTHRLRLPCPDLAGERIRLEWTAAREARGDLSNAARLSTRGD